MECRRLPYPNFIWETDKQKGLVKHVVNDESLLCDYTQLVNLNTYSRGYSESPPEFLGVGALLVMLMDWMLIRFINVNYTNGLTYTLISQFAACDNGFEPITKSINSFVCFSTHEVTQDFPIKVGSDFCY